MSNNNGVELIYLVALLWIILPNIIPFVHPLLIVATIFAVVFNMIKAKTKQTEQTTQKPQPQTETEKPQPETKTKTNSKVDELIKMRDDAISEMRRLNVNIEDPTITSQINDIEYTTTKIFDHVIAHPEKVDQISKYFNYYLPTTIKLLNNYDQMNSQGVKGENITNAMERIEKAMQTIVGAYHKQLDTLFAGEVLDINSDITVMQNLMQQEGLTDNGENEIKLTTQGI